MNLADHVATLGRGPGRSRSLTREEAADAMACMLSDETAPEAIGALLMLLRMKGEIPPEIAGFAETASATAMSLPRADLDWPSYAAGRTRGRPWFLLAARLVAQAGYRVVLHGRNNHEEAVRAHLAAAGVPLATTEAAAQSAFDTNGLVYLPLEAIHPRLTALLALRGVLGLRSCINTVCRMLNPTQAPASVQGVFHPSYRMVQTEAAALLNWQALTVIKGGGGEFERHPGKTATGFGLRDGHIADLTRPALREDTRRLSEVSSAVDIDGLWSGAHRDPFAEEIVIGTAALALETLGHDAPEDSAQTLWDTRHQPQETAA